MIENKLKNNDDERIEKNKLEKWRVQKEKIEKIEKIK